MLEILKSSDYIKYILSVRTDLSLSKNLAHFSPQNELFTSKEN